jgi:hypothetical protein
MLPTIFLRGAHVPDNAVSREGLERLYEAMNREFDRRATAAWTAARGRSIYSPRQAKSWAPGGEPVTPRLARDQRKETRP